MQIGDAVRFRADAPHRDTLGPMADEIGMVVDVAQIDGVETLAVKFGDIGPIEAGVPAAEFEPVLGSWCISGLDERLRPKRHRGRVDDVATFVSDGYENATASIIRRRRLDI